MYIEISFSDGPPADGKVPPPMEYLSTVMGKCMWGKYENEIIFGTSHFQVAAQFSFSYEDVDVEFSYLKFYFTKTVMSVIHLNV